MTEFLGSSASGDRFSSGEAGSANTYLSPAYTKSMDVALAEHTGSPHKFLTPEQEQEMAVTIQAGKRAIDIDIPELERAIDGLAEIPDELLARYRAALQARGQAQAEVNKLVSCNLKFAVFMARASMNILPSDDDREAESFRLRVPRTFANIRKLRSSEAVLADRVQAANEGLIDAAWKFEPGVAGKTGKKAAFIGYAAYHVHKRIYNHVVENEEPLLTLTRSQFETVNKYRKRGDSLNIERRIELMQLFALQHPIQLDEVSDDQIAVTERDATFAATLPSFLAEALGAALDTIPIRRRAVLKMRYGIDVEEPMTIEAIGQVFGVTRERIRQIETQAMAQMRHPSRLGLLSDFVNKPAPEPPVRPHAHPIVPPPADRESWQLFPGESWDAPVRLSPAESEARNEKIITTLTEMIHQGSIGSFRLPKHHEARAQYPGGLVHQIEQTFGGNLRTEHIAAAWERSLTDIIGQSREKLGDAFSIDRVSQLFARLFADHIKDNDSLELVIPPLLEEKLNYVGAWLRAGELRIVGDVGDYAGASMEGTGKLVIDGNVGSHVGMAAHDYASVVVAGDAGDFAGCAVRGQATVNVVGSVGDYCGYQLSSKEARVTVGGDAGLRVGARAFYGSITIDGYAQSLEIPRRFVGDIAAAGFGGIEQGK